ncbi:PQQ-dependent sugar dehydrogenase [uncultured Paraglaciecola sp.]|uniref:PQQ-dependent sugar dehydrogenase n=1 Tax=uncultured Paraglaciecola sp. TaxID=1765024 RepID=UPI002629FCB0|nr:PQQ-dependent sugar dehydrogenase [uncultured Paraglaciecola sp.]
MRHTIISFLLIFFTACSGSSNSTSPASPPITTVLPVLSISEAVGVEGTLNNTVLVFSIQLSFSSSNVVSVDFITQDDTAIAGEDYFASNGTLDIPAGQSNVTLEITIIADENEEQDEQFSVQLSNPQGATLGVTQANAIIENDDTDQNLSGIPNRPDNQNCVAPPQPSQQSTIAIEQVYTQLPNFNQPVKLLQEPFATGRWFVLEKGGLLKVFDYGSPQSVEVFLNLSNKVNTASEGGLLGMAFHPDYPSVPEIFLYYTAPHSSPSMRSMVSRWILDDVEKPIMASEQVIIQIDQDFNNHNGGDIGFGNDGFLYVGLGDGGSGGDPNNRAQDTHYLLGSMLRLDVTGENVNFPSQPYSIPIDNPFAENPICGPAINAEPCPEIFAWGLRNPYRWNFDAITGDLWVADVGQSTAEEINKVELGGNYGWRCNEGFEAFDQNGCPENLLPPLSTYGRSLGSSITGGMLYRGSNLVNLQGKYVFADFGSGRIWSLSSDSQGQYVNHELLNVASGITSFAADHNGELFLTNFYDGKLYRITSTNPLQNEFPQLLSETGCVNMNKDNLAQDGTIPFNPRVSFWSDGAEKERYIAIPNATQIEYSESNNWAFPEGTVLVKHFRVQQQLIESRLLMRHENGNWAGYVYQWNNAQTDATRVIGGKAIEFGNQQYRIPSEDECLTCHTQASGVVLGFSEKQLNHHFKYPQTNVTAHQLLTLSEINYLEFAPDIPIDSLPALVDFNDPQLDLAARARSYLDVNCANCHQPGAVSRTNIDLRFTALLSQSNTCGVTPQLGSLELNNPSIISPGDSSRSVLLERMQRRDANAMPPIGSHLVDQQGVELVRQWIEQLSNCN